MQRVRAPARLGRGGRIAAAAVAVAAVAAVAAAVVLAAVAPGPDARPPTRHAGPVAAPPQGGAPKAVATIGGKALQSARCRQWRGASAREKDRVVATLAHVVGGSTPYGPATTLPATVAHQLFDRACARTYARGFLLYELYTRAAAFSDTPQRRL